MEIHVPDLGRLVEIKGFSEGTGFLVADGLILTAWHLLRPPAGEPLLPGVRVRLQRDLKVGMPVDAADQMATMLWPQCEPGADLDFALLGLPLSRDARSRGEVEQATGWASLGQWGEVEVTAAGYPDVAIDHELGRRDTKGITGWIQLADNARNLADGRGTFTIRLRDEDLPAAPAAIAWPAMSGAAVFAGRVLVGVIRIVGEERSRHRLHALPIDRLFARQDVVDAIRTAGYPIPPHVDLSSTIGEAPGTYSLAWNVPYPRNLQFTGRSDIIARLAVELNSGSAAAVTQSITGLGGIGKTQVALEYCYRNRTRYRIVWWIRAESKETQIADLTALGRALRLTDIESASESNAATAIEWLNRAQGWLLVYDNVEEASHLTGLLPTSGSGHILITSRNPNWPTLAKALELDVWTAEEASRYLLMRTSLADTQANKEAATKLAGALGNLPLAIEQAAAYIDECKIGIVQYTRLFAAQKLNILRARSGQSKAEQTIAMVWEISLRRVESASPGAVALLTLCAFMNPDQISKEKIEKNHKVLPKQLRPIAANTIALHDAIALLRRYSLINATEHFISIHRLVQLVVRERLNPRNFKRFHKAAYGLEHGENNSPDLIEETRERALHRIWDLASKGDAGWLTRRKVLAAAGTVAGAASAATLGVTAYRFLNPLNTDLTIAGLTIADLIKIADSEGPVTAITTLASRSPSAQINWRGSGIAPIGYTKGMALVFARVYLKLKAADSVAIDMAKAATGDTSSDALSWYAPLFSAAGMNNDVSGVDTLRHLFVLLTGLGMSESAGRYCAGWDRSVGNNIESSTAEAGLFQATQNSMQASPLLLAVFEQYSAHQSGFVDVFKEGVQCSDADVKVFGTGMGLEFQRLSKSCPAFAVEYAGLLLRNLRRHFGPINSQMAELRLECDEMLRGVQYFADQWRDWSELLVDTDVTVGGIGGGANAGAFSLTWLPEVLRSAGLKVAEQPGWRTRGHGDVGTIMGVMCHHTSGPLSGNMPSLGIITNGHPDDPGPHAQLTLGRDGTFFVVAAGRANHAGQGMWQGIRNGNSSFIGIVAENTGYTSGPMADPWPVVQLDAYRRGVAAILKKIGANAIMCCGHKEYALPQGRKDDPSFDMHEFRDQVAAIMAGTAPDQP